MTQTFDYWNHFCETEKEIMRVERDTLKFLVYTNTPEELPEWYDQSDINEDIEDIEDYTSEFEYENTFFNTNLTIEDESMLEYEDTLNDYIESDSESDHDNEWTTI